MSQLSLFGLAKTRKVATALHADAGDTGGTDVSSISVWTPPEALAGSAAVEEPEAAEAEKESGVAADAYAFGMIAWEVREGEGRGFRFCYLDGEGLPPSGRGIGRSCVVFEGVTHRGVQYVSVVGSFPVVLVAAPCLG